MALYYLPVFAKALALTVFALALTVLLGPLNAGEPVKLKRIAVTADDTA